ncbi:MAG: lysine exporter LysO family protein [Bacteroides sp.]|nr:lysine exporter LysO family protein [Bacteroides sp.]MCM1447246.1 lysine exporter LysO family protein [Bacteroides sp.]MCM1516300.1 lysine exporter LysO family protein [Paraprevotella sp.]
MKILLLLLLSIGCGLLLRNVRQLRYLQYTSTWTVWALLLFFGIALGGNDAIVGNFIHYGFTAFVVAIAGVAGSVLAAWGVRMAMDNKRRR